MECFFLQKITPFTFHGVISNITEMKEKIIGRCEIGMLTDGDRDVLNSTENMLLGAYMKSVLRMTAQSQVSWAHPEYIKRRLVSFLDRIFLLDLRSLLQFDSFYLTCANLKEKILNEFNLNFC